MSNTSQIAALMGTIPIGLMLAAAPASAGSEVNVAWNPAPVITSADGQFEVGLHGRLFVDGGFTDDADGTADIERAEARAARLGLAGKIGADVQFKFEIDFAHADVEVKDAYLQWAPSTLKGGKLTFGQHKTYNSLEEQTSSKYTTFVERTSFTDAFDLARMLGFGMGWGDDVNGVAYSLNFGIFRGDFETDANQKTTAYSARATLGPKVNDAQFHFGASVRRRERKDMRTLRFRQRPHAHLSDRFVNTGAIAGDDTFYGVEGALVHGPLSIQSEYAWNKVNLNATGVSVGNGADPTFHGGYIDVSYFLTGETRKYEAKKGKFGRVKVNNSVFEGGSGAFQIAYRFDKIDLTEQGIFGGEQDSHIAGVNWHLANHVRLMFNYNHSKIKDAFLSGNNGIDGKNKVDAFTIRAQVDW